jgi:hypothetical protein
VSRIEAIISDFGGVPTSLLLGSFLHGHAGLDPYRP